MHPNRVEELHVRGGPQETVFSEKEKLHINVLELTPNKFAIMTFTVRQKVDTTMQLHNGIITTLSHLLKMWRGMHKIHDYLL